MNDCEKAPDCENYKAKEKKYDIKVGELKLWEKVELKNGHIYVCLCLVTKGFMFMLTTNGTSRKAIACDTPCRRIGRYEYVPEGEGFMRGTGLEYANGYHFFTNLTLCHSTHTTEIPPRPKFDMMAGKCVKGKKKQYEFPPDTKDAQGLLIESGPWLFHWRRTCGDILFEQASGLSTRCIHPVTPCREVPAPTAYDTPVEDVPKGRWWSLRRGRRTVKTSRCL